MSAWYNEIDPQKAAWLRELIRQGVIADGEVDERDVKLVQPGDLRGFTQCHFFAGIGVWSYALRLAGWPDDRPVWTGSCPCPSFSCAGKGGGFDDPRHLWPAWYRLIPVCRPPTIFGEQADDAIGFGWLDLVQTDLEREAFAVGKAVLGACSVGAPHIRQRLYFVAHNLEGRREQLTAARIHAPGSPRDNVDGCGNALGIAHSTGSRRQGEREHGSGQSPLPARSEQCVSTLGSPDTERDGRRTNVAQREAQGRIADGRDRPVSLSPNAENGDRRSGERGTQAGVGSDGEWRRGVASDGTPSLGADAMRTRPSSEQVERQSREAETDPASARSGVGGSAEPERDGRGTRSTSEPRQESRDALAYNRSEPSTSGDTDLSSSARLGEFSRQSEGESQGTRGLRHGPGADGRTIDASASRLSDGEPEDLLGARRGSEGRTVAEPSPTSGFWGDCDWWYGRDGKHRPIEPGVFPLAHGVANRVLKLRGYGDAIVPQVAATFIEAYINID